MLGKYADEASKMREKGREDVEYHACTVVRIIIIIRDESHTINKQRIACEEKKKEREFSVELQRYGLSKNFISHTVLQIRLDITPAGPDSD